MTEKSLQYCVHMATLTRGFDSSQKHSLGDFTTQRNSFISSSPYGEKRADKCWPLPTLEICSPFLVSFLPCWLLLLCPFSETRSTQALNIGHLELSQGIPSHLHLCSLEELIQAQVFNYFQCVCNHQMYIFRIPFRVLQRNRTNGIERDKKRRVIVTQLSPRLSRWLSGKEPPDSQATQVWSLGQEDPLKEEMATHYSIPARKIPWTEGPRGLQSMGITKSQTQPSNWAHTRSPRICSLQDGDPGRPVV